MKHTWHKGIAMIELIFALVILGITLMSAPMLISQATTSSTVTFQQESIAMVASHTSALMTYQWDENNTLPVANPNRDMLRVPASIDADAELDDQNATNPFGRTAAALTFPNGRRRLMSIDAGAPVVPARQATPYIGADANDIDDIDDFNNTNLATSLASVATNLTEQGEYMDTQIILATAVNYASDITVYNTLALINRPPLTATANRTNIKTITTTLTSAQIPDKRIVLQAFMCNIGGNTVLDEGTF